MSAMRFRNFGGIHQFTVREEADLARIDALDPARWAATSAPLRDLRCDPGFPPVMDPAARKITATFKVGHRPRNVAFTADDKFAYINAENDGTVTLVDVAKKKVIKTIQLGKAGEVKRLKALGRAQQTAG